MNSSFTKKIMDLLRKHQIKIYIITIFLIVIGVFLIRKGLKIDLGGHYYRVRYLTQKIASYGSLSIVIFFLVYLVKSFFVILPSWPLIVAAGSIYGPLNGFILSMICALSSASFSFVLARFAGRTIVQKLLGKRANFLDQKLESYGVRIIAVMRVSFIVPFDILSFVAGVTKVTYTDFIFGTFIGIVAEVFALTYLGNNLVKPRMLGFVISAVTILLVVLVPIIWSKFKKTPNN